MLRLDLFHFYRLGHYIHPVTELRKASLPINVIGGADQFLRLLIDSPHEPVPLKLSIASAQRLMDAHADLGRRYGMRLLRSIGEDAGDDIFFMPAVEAVERAARDFEAVFELELLSSHAYFVSLKGAYDTAVLMERAEAAVAESLLQSLPPHAIQDFREAGKCLALEVPTACGYHVTRAVEAVLRHWHGLQVGGAPSDATPDKAQNNPTLTARRWAKCEQDLIASGAPKSTVGILTQIRELHRNPLMHPEIFLTIEEAISLFDISKSAIEAMAREILGRSK